MDFEGFIEKGLSRRKDRLRFNKLDREQASEVEAAQVRMATSIRAVHKFAILHDEEGFLPVDKIWMRYATPWLCETTSEAGDAKASIRVLYSREGDPGLAAMGTGCIQARIETQDEDGSPDVTEVLLGKFNDYWSGAVVMTIDSDTDTGLVGSPSWEQMQSILDEAHAELQTIMPTQTNSEATVV